MLDNDEVKALIPVLYLKSMVFQFNLGKVEDTFEHYVSWWILNDNGEPIKLEVAYILVQEFWKLMFINASEILLNKKMGNMDWNENKKFGKRGWSFSARMPAAFYIDLVWQMAVWFDFYEDYCDFIAGGYIERFDAINKEMHKKYWKCYLRYFTKQFFTSLNACPCFWPELKEYNDFELEF